MEKIEIITLCDNSALLKPKMLAEHGLSLFIKTDDVQFLLDTGQTIVAKKNAMALGLDLKEVPIVLSHGHYDHCGGLPLILELTGCTTVYAHPGIFEEKYNGQRYIGLSESKEELEDLGANFNLDRRPKRLAPGLWLSGQIPRRSFETAEGELKVRNDKGELVWDLVEDDQSIILDLDDGLMILTGCAHSGIINTIEHAKRITGNPNVAGIIGGTHLANVSETQLYETISALEGYDMNIISPCHCTGTRVISIMASRFKDRLVFNGTGKTIEL